MDEPKLTNRILDVLDRCVAAAEAYDDDANLMVSADHVALAKRFVEKTKKYRVWVKKDR